jgi:hypothetical protein
VTAATPTGEGAPAPFALIPLGSADAAACEGDACLIPGAATAAPGVATPAPAPASAS